MIFLKLNTVKHDSNIWKVCLKRFVYILYGLGAMCCMIAVINPGNITNNIVDGLYPEYIIENKDFSSEKVELKDFKLLDTGQIKSISGDPWVCIYFDNNGINRVLSLSIEIVSATNENEAATIYYVDSYQSQSMLMSSGRHNVILKLLQNSDVGLRLDLTGHRDEIIKIDRISINNNQYLTVYFRQRIAGWLIWFGLIGLVMWIKEKRKRVYGLSWVITFFYWILGSIFASQIFCGRISDGIVYMVLLLFFAILCIYDNIDAGLFVLLYSFLHGYLQYKLNDYRVESYVRYYFINSVLVLNVLLIVMVVVSIRNILGRHLGNLLCGCIYVVYAVANIIKMKYQNALIRRADIRLWKEIWNIADQYIGKNGIVLLICGLLLPVILIVIYRNRFFSYFKPEFRKWAYPMTVLLGVFIFCILTNYFAIFGINVNTYYSTDKEKLNAMGFGVYSLLEFTRSNKSNEPMGYCEDIVNEMEAYRDNSTLNERRPIVILILAESLCDVDKIPDVSFNEELLGNLKEYRVTSILSPSYGGRTAVAEYEALSGMSDVFVEGNNIVYGAYLNKNGRETGSLAREFSDAGYLTYAIHANRADYYNRDIAYANMGFDDFISREDFHLTEEDYLVEGGVNDKAFVDEIIEILQSEEKPVFIFGASLEGHGPYTSKYASTQIEAISDKYEGSVLQELNSYGQTVYNFDLQMGRLIDYLDHCEQEALMYIFGDHRPALAVNDQNGCLDDVWQKYQTPLYAYSNYCDVSISDEVLSLNQIAPEILKKSGIDHRAYFDYIYELRSVYPVVHREIGLDLSNEMLRKYNEIQWDLLFGEKYLLQ